MTALSEMPPQTPKANDAQDYVLDHVQELAKLARNFGMIGFAIDLELAYVAEMSRERT
jgi:orotidine-5'-phosphate decarboxylase